MRHLYRGFNTASASERLGSGLPIAYERLGSIELNNSSYFQNISFNREVASFNGSQVDRHGGVWVKNVLMFSAVHGISRTLYFWTP